MRDGVQLVSDLRGLCRAIVDAGTSKTSLAAKLSKDKATISRWYDGSVLPSEPRDVAWLIRVALATGVDIARYQIFDPIYDFSQHLTYEQKQSVAPPDFSAFTEIRRPPKVDWNVCGMSVNCPLGISSSPLLADDRWADLMLGLGYGLSTLKTRRTAAKVSWDAPQVAFITQAPNLSDYDPANPPEVEVSLDRTRALGVIPNLVNSIGVPSEHPADWKQIYQKIRRLEGGHTVGVSVMGDGDSQTAIARDLAVAVAEARELAPPFIEINASCPNLEKRGQLGNDLAFLKTLALAARAELSGSDARLFVKFPFIPPLLMEGFLKTLAPHVDAVVFRNSIRVRPFRFDRDGNKIPAFPNRVFGGLTGPITYESTRVGIEAAVEARRRLKLELGLIAVGGVSTVREVVDILNVGADAVQVVTAPMFDPLLAWKVRFHMERSVSATPKLRGGVHYEALLLPRDETEQISFKNAQTAVAIVERKMAPERVSVTTFTQAWNDWMQERPSINPGAAQRVPGPRSESDWIRVFLR